MKKKSEFILIKPLNHVALIMDGNGRWAKKRMLPRNLGHKEGCKRIVDIMEACKDYKIKVMTLYAFSTENWSRPKEEIDFLFSYIGEFFDNYIETCMKDDVQIRVMGDISIIPEDARRIIEKAIEMTKNNKSYVFNICLNYGSRQEILRSAQLCCEEVISKGLTPKDITKEMFEKNLYSHDLPEVDLMIRTSGECRLSNYILYQLAYSEFIFTKTFWPDFTKKEFTKCLEEYCLRNRRFGSLKNN